MGYRAVVYICSMPAALTPEVVYAQKRRAYERLETGCHYPSREEWFEMGEKHKQFDWKPYFSSPPKLTLRQQELYGLVRYGTSEAQAGDNAASSSSPRRDSNAQLASTSSSVQQGDQKQ